MFQHNMSLLHLKACLLPAFMPTAEMFLPDLREYLSESASVTLFGPWAVMEAPKPHDERHMSTNVRAAAFARIARRCVQTVIACLLACAVVGCRDSRWLCLKLHVFHTEMDSRKSKITYMLHSMMAFLYFAARMGLTSFPCFQQRHVAQTYALMVLIIQWESQSPCLTYGWEIIAITKNCNRCLRLAFFLPFSNILYKKYFMNKKDEDTVVVGVFLLGFVGNDFGLWTWTHLTFCQSFNHRRMYVLYA